MWRINEVNEQRSYHASLFNYSIPYRLSHRYASVCRRAIKQLRMQYYINDTGGATTGRMYNDVKLVSFVTT